MVTKNIRNGFLCAVAMLMVNSQAYAAAEAMPKSNMMSFASAKKAMNNCLRMPKNMARYAWYGIESENPCGCTVWADRAFRLLGIAAVAYHGYVALPKVYAYLKAKVAAEHNRA